MKFSLKLSYHKVFVSATWCKRSLLYDQIIRHKHLFSCFLVELRGWLKLPGHAGGSNDPTLLYTYVHVYIHTCVHRLYIHTYIHTYIHIHTYIQTYIHIHTYIHTYIQYYIHTYIHIHAFIPLEYIAHFWIITAARFATIPVSEWFGYDPNHSDDTWWGLQ